MTIAKIEARAKAALAHRDLKPVMALVPVNERDSPAHLRRWLSLAAEVAPERFADSPALNDAFGALLQVENARGLRDKVAALYHSGALRAQATAAGLDFEGLYSRPDEAYALLVSRGATGRLTKEFDEALSTLSEVREFARESGAPLQPDAAKPIPAGQDAQDDEYQTLIKATATGKATKAQDDRLMQLAAARIAREEQQEAAAEAAGGTRPPPDEYRTLIEKSVSGGPLSPAESARLNHLAGDRAVEAGLVTAEDIETERETADE
jgi:hypothetical protein